MQPTADVRSAARPSTTPRDADSRSTRRDVCLLAVALPLAGCVSDPGADCRGATVRLSLQPVRTVQSPLVLDSERLSAEAVVVVETAIEDKHIERCVSWHPGAGETGASPGLAELGELLEAHAGVELPADIETDARFRGDPYRLSLVTDRNG
ncbi:hypothetical protein [Natronomonas moolapensis]|jgi:hypothetical protein|uniref:hypothetical protein n=1 Tax=Natronomonas moolapensis TaxID=416273 RepID=UPI0006778CE2|nr:hypothetical protein [Natronomonas moolapensis]